MNDIEAKGKSNFSYLKYLAKKNETDIHPKGKTATDLLIKKLEIKDGQNVLEVGFGAGKTLVRLASAFNINLYGIDAMPEMFYNAEKRISNAGLNNRIKIFLPERRKFPFPNDFFDMAFAESVLGFQDDDDLNSLIDEIKRVLKTKGIFAANDVVWKKGLNDEIVTKINAECLNDFGMRHATQDYWNYEDWKNFYIKNGFEILSSELIPDQDRPEINGNGKSPGLTLRSPFILFKDLRYRMKMRKHKNDKEYVEARLFLMQKR
ncbi:MAG TPA: class I SAM-dependent methyltransferase [Ignavibacteriaceae bacterium]|nr:class I SAM-dependent methyltransferase [Ignavibacteriaceae bacterium]